MASKVEAVIVGKKAANHDCYVFSFEFVNEPIHFHTGQHFRIIKELKTHEHPEGEVLVRKYTPINPCSEKVTLLSIRKQSTSWSRSIDPTFTPISLMAENTLRSSRLNKLETNSPLKGHSADSTTVLQEKLLSVLVKIFRW